jgi:hypothetical protein
MHGAPPERHGVRPSLSIWLWGLAWPLLTAILALLLGPAYLLLFLAYPLLAWKIARSRRWSHGDPWSHCLLYGVACVAGKWPQLAGQWTYLLRRIKGEPPAIIEYKQAAASVERPQ